MAANKASRRGSNRREQRSEEGSAARPLAREPLSEAPQSEPPAAEEGAGPSGETLAALERAADNIRPSWHDAEPPPAPHESGPVHASSGPLPPPPALPSFSSFPFEQPALHYRADSTLRTAAVLPERLAQLLSQPHVAYARSRALREIGFASHWLRARPWALGGLAAVAGLLLIWLLWPSAPEAATHIAAAPKPPTHATPAPPGAAAPAGTSLASDRESVNAKPTEPIPPSAAVKKREKRKAPAKATTAKAPVVTTKAPIVKGPVVKAQKAAKAPAAPAR